MVSSDNPNLAHLIPLVAPCHRHHFFPNGGTRDEHDSHDRQLPFVPVLEHRCHFDLRWTTLHKGGESPPWNVKCDDCTSVHHIYRPRHAQVHGKQKSQLHVTCSDLPDRGHSFGYIRMRTRFGLTHILHTCPATHSRTHTQRIARMW